MFFRKKPPLPSPTETDPYLELQPHLVRLLQNCGLPVRTQSHWALVNSELPALRASARPPSYHPARVFQQIDVELRLDESLSIIECYGGGGETLEAAQSEALLTFLVGAFQVYASAFWGHAHGEVQTEPWIINGSRWTAFVGSTIRKSTGHNTDAAAPDMLPQAVRDYARVLPLSSDHHWISTYYGRVGDDASVEAQIDNQRSPELANNILALPWERTEGFYSERNFILLRRQPEP